MTWKIEFDLVAKKELNKLDPQHARRLVQFLFERIAHLEDPRSIGEALKGSRFGTFWKYRVGEYRIICNIEDGLTRILVIRIGNRKEIYR